MKLFYVTIICFWFCSIECYSQQWKDGLILPFNGDTLTGQLHCKLRKNAGGEVESVSFRKDKKEKPAVYKSLDLQYFLVDGARYLNVRLDEQKGKELVMRDAWAKLLVDGPDVSLFEYRGQFYFSYRSEDEFIYCTRLDYSTWEEYNADKELVTPKANVYYKRQLRAIATHFQLMDRLHGQIDSCPYNHYYLASLFMQLNRGKGRLLYPHQQDTWRFSLFLSTGRGFFRDRIYEDDLVAGSTREFNMQRSYYAIGADIHPSGLDLFFRLNLAYSSTGLYRGETITNYNNKQAFQFEQNTLCGGLSFLYPFYRRPKVDVFGGLSMSYFTALGNRDIPFTSGHLIAQDDLLQLRKGVMVLGLSGSVQYKGIWEAGFNVVPPISWVESGYHSLLKSQGITFFLACHILNFSTREKEDLTPDFYRH